MFRAGNRLPCWGCVVQEDLTVSSLDMQQCHRWHMNPTVG